MSIGSGMQIITPRSAAAVALHIEDSFTAANGTDLGGWTPDVANTPGNTWVEALLSWTIISNCARGTNYQKSLLVIESGASDGVITMPCQKGGNQNGIVFRYVDNDNYWYAITSSVGGYSIYEVTAGASTRRADNETAILTTTLTMTVTLSGNDITVLYNGKTLNYSSAIRATATKHGIIRQDWNDNGVADWWKMV